MKEREMRVILFLLAGLALFDGFVTYTGAETIMQQIAGIMVLVLSGILFSGAAIVDAVVGLKQEIRKITGPAEELAKRKEEIIDANNQYLADRISAKE